MNPIQIVTCIIGFIFGFGQMIDFQIMGRITAADFVVWLPIPYYLISCKQVLFSKRGAIVVGLVAIYVMSVLISNYFAGCSPEQMIKGILRVLFTFAYAIFFLWLFLRNPKALWAVIVGAALGAPFILLHPGSYLDAIASEEGYGKWAAIYQPIILNFLILVGCIIYRKHHIITALLLFVSFLAMSPLVPRSITMIGLIAALILMYEAYLNRQNIRRNTAERKWKFFGFGMMIFVSLILIYAAYVHAAPAGLLGEYQKEKFIDQTNDCQNVSPLELLMNGRSDFVSATFAVRDHPFLGIGSWNSNAWNTYRQEAYYARSAEMSNAMRESMNIQLYSHHSTFFGEWAEGGIGAPFFWLFVLYCSFMLLANLIANDNLFLPFFVLMIMNFFWNFFFSPMNISVRMETGIIIAVYLLQFSPESPRYPIIFDWLLPNTIGKRRLPRNRPAIRRNA